MKLKPRNYIVTVIVICSLFFKVTSYIKVLVLDIEHLITIYSYNLKLALVYLHYLDCFESHLYCSVCVFVPAIGCFECSFFSLFL